MADDVPAPPRRKPRSAAERTLHRLHIAMMDLYQASEFIEAVQALQKSGVDPETDLTHRALMCAAVVYYARPFMPNEHRNPRKRRADAADTAVVLEPLRRWLPDAKCRALHREVIRQRNKIVAHAESRFFDSKMARSARTPANVYYTEGYARVVRRVYPRFDLEALRFNAYALHNACSFMASAIVSETRRGKRLRPDQPRPAPT